MGFRCSRGRREDLWKEQSPFSKSTIQWAAFFSDCEQEVLQVTQGHRLTLTYNLFWVRSGPVFHQMTLDPETFHFYSALKALLACPNFLPNGES